MANPQSPGTFDAWITDRLTFATLTPKTGDTGGFDAWITDRLYFADYVEAADVLVVVNVTEAITVSESITLLVVSFVSVTDSIAVSESVAAQLLTAIQASDAISTSEIVTVAPPDPLVISVSDASTVSDAPSVSVATAVTIIVVIRRVWVGYLRQSTAATIKIGPFLDSGNGITPKTALTLSQADIRLSKNGAAFAQKNESSAAVHDENGWYAVALNATDTDTLGRLQVAVNEAGAIPVEHESCVLSAHGYDELTFGQNPIDFTYTLTSDQPPYSPISGATIRITTDIAGLNTVWTGTTDVVGVARNLCGELPRLTAATYHFFRSHASFNFTNPDSEAVG